MKVLLSSLLVLTPFAALAHHSNAGYDFDTVTELEGELVGISWRNPHVHLTLSSPDGSGQWDLEAQDINSLGRRGLSPELLHVGDTIKVAGNLSRRSDRSLFVTNVLLPDGTEIRTRGDDTAPRWSTKVLGFATVNVDEVQAAAGKRTGLFRVWLRTGQGGFPPELPLTPSARAAHDAWDEADNLVARCVAPGMPSAMEIRGPHPIDFAERDGDIILRAEIFDLVRTIHMNPGLDALPESPTPLGYSIGRWEDDDTLVVETTRIDWPYFDREGRIPQSDQVTTTERFAVDEDTNRLRYSLRVTDPATFAAPVTAEWLLDWRPDLVVEPYRCELGG